MGVDARIKDLVNEIESNELAAVLSTMYMAVDAASFSDAQKVKWSTLITNEVVAANTNNYQAMTPKSFYDSVMATNRYGIGRYATNEEVTNKTTSGLIRSEQQEIMQAQWKADLFQTTGVPSVVYQSEYGIGYIANYFDNAMGPQELIELSPILVMPHPIYCFNISLVIGHNESNTQVYKSCSNNVNYWAINSYWALQCSVDRKHLYLVSLSNATGVKVSCTVNMVLAY
jgi:hypothetical protein